MSRDHRKLRAFELADELALRVYEVTREFPCEEIFGLTSQMRRASVAVAANIVEGCGRMNEREYRNFLNISFASLREVGYYLSLSRRLRYMSPETADQLDGLFSETARVLAALMNSLKSSE